MNHYLQLATEKLNSLKGQLDYANEALSSDLESWERKEFELLKSDCENKITEQETLIKTQF